MFEGIIAPGSALGNTVVEGTACMYLCVFVGTV